MDLKEQLLAATVQVITDQGWKAATTRRIAEAAGVNEVTLFRHFGSKDALIREAMAWHSARVCLTELPPEPGDPRAELVTWTQQQYAHLLEMRGHIRRTIGEFEANPEIASWSRRIPRRLHQNLEQYLGRLRETGRAQGDWEPRTAASFLIGALFADAINRDFLPQHLSEPADDVPRRYVEFFLAAIGYAE